MDMVHSIPADKLRKIIVFVESEDIQLVLVQKHGLSIYRWKHYYSAESIELLEVVDTSTMGHHINLSDLNQIEKLSIGDHQNCLLFGGYRSTSIYCLIGRKFLLWQVMKHNDTSSPFAWSFIRSPFELNDDDQALDLLVFNAVQTFEFYLPDSADRFSLVSTSHRHSNCRPDISIALVGTSSAGSAMILQTCSVDSGVTYLRGYQLDLNEYATGNSGRQPETDSLIGSISEIDWLLEQINAVADVEALLDNLVYVDDDFTTDGTVFVEEFAYDSAVSDLARFVVVEEAADETDGGNVSPGQVQDKVNQLADDAQTFAREIPDLIYPTNSSNYLTGGLTFTSSEVLVEDANLPTVYTSTINGGIWGDFVSSVWLYSADQTIDHDLEIANVLANNIDTGPYEVGGVLPSDWVLLPNISLNGMVSFENLEVLGNIVILDDNQLNGVNVADIVNRNGDGRVDGNKKFTSMSVGSVMEAPLVNDKDFSDWFQSVALANSPERQVWTGNVDVVGPVEVAGELMCKSINGIPLPQLPDLLVTQNSDQVIHGELVAQ